MYTNLPHVYEGEIVEVMAPDSNFRDNVVRYICRVRLKGNGDVLIPNVIESNPFGGIADYSQRRARASKDSGDEFRTGLSDGASQARIGDRVMVMFLGGHVEQPVIIGCLPHPNQTKEFDDPSKIKPQSIIQYQGVRVRVTDDGSLQVVHKGSPTITPAPGAGEQPSGPTSIAAGPGSAAIAPAPETELVLFEMVKNGVFRIRDHEGQMIEIDRTKNRIYISNNDLKSTEDPEAGPASGGNQAGTNSTDAEYVMLEKDKQRVLINARKQLTLYSFDKRRDVTEGDQIQKTKGSWTVEVDGDVSIKGSGGSQMALSGGQVALGGPTGEVMDLLDQTLQALSTTQDSLGYPVSTVPLFVQLKIQWELLKGSLK